MWPFNKKTIVSAKPRKAVLPQQRNFKMAKQGRLTASWQGTSVSLDSILVRTLPLLQRRSRDLFWNNEFAKKFGQMSVTHVVGPIGFTPKIRVLHEDGSTDTMDSKAISDAFYKWMKPQNCDVTGKSGFIGLCSTFITSVARDGEALFRKVYGEGAGPFGYQLQALSVDRLDVNKNELLAGGNIIRMGVEITPVGKPVAYWLFRRHPGDHANPSAGQSVYERVPAEDIFHCFIPMSEEQTRGVPWVHAAAIRLENLGGYEEAAVIASRIGASKMGFYTTPEGDAVELADGQQSPDGDLHQEAEPGVFDVLPSGYGFTSFDPDYPHQMYDVFVKACLRGVASGLGVAYNTLSNDLEGVNFSSIRSGVLEERDNWKVIQNWMIESFLDQVFTDWLRWSLLMGAIRTPKGFPLPASKFEKFNACIWKGRRWQWVDPVKDMQASILGIQNNLKSREDVIDEIGGDYEEVFAQLSAEQELLKSYDLPVSTIPAKDEGDKDKKKPKEGEDE